MPPAVHMATIPVFMNTDGLPTAFLLPMPNVSVVNAEIEIQSVATQHWSILARVGIRGHV